MADSREITRPQALAPLCATCMQLFQGHHKLRVDSIFLTAAVITSIKPQSCRICLIISSRHEKFIRGLGEAPELFEVRYLYLHGDVSPSAMAVQDWLELRFSLHYANNQSEYISLAVMHTAHAEKLSLRQCLSPNTGSDESIVFLKSRFKECLENHHNCRRKLGLRRSWLPSRILEIGGSSSQTVRLRNREESTSQDYFTLSHCWGKEIPLRLTKETESSLRAGISTDCLPKTFRDAVAVTIKFGVSYLWIDSLCIFQDDLGDWHEQAAAMCDTYSYALCNVAATGAPDGSYGLFSERNPAVESPLRVQTIWDFESSLSKDPSFPAGIYDIFPRDQWVRDLEQGPLNRRAWVMQERFLSTRVLHFSASQVFWECLENTSGELFPDTIPAIAGPFWLEDSQKLKQAVFQYQPADKDKWHDLLYSSWQVFVRSYTRCGLSEEGDKLVAIDGVAQLLSKMAGVRFVGGLWHSRLLQELCWMRVTDYKDKNLFPKFHPQNWRAPSWSWAGTDVTAHPGNVRHHVESRCSKLQPKVSVEEIVVDAHDSGQLKHASLTLRGEPLYATFVEENEGKNFLDGSNTLICGRSTITAGRNHYRSPFELIFDNPDQVIQSQQEFVFLCIYTCCDCTSAVFKKPTQYLVALALRAEDVEKSHYKRVGLLEMHNSGFDFYMEHKASKECNITLV